MANGNTIPDGKDELEDIFSDDVTTNEDDERVKAEILASFDDGDDEPDDSGMDQPLEDEEPLDLKSHTEGQRAIERGEEERRKERKTADVPDASSDDDGKKTEGYVKKDGEKEDPADPNAKPSDDAEGDEGKKSEDDDDEKEKADLSKAEFDSLLDGVPDDRKAEISRRMKESASVMEPFQTPYVQDQMKRHGVEPKQIASRLVELASFAEQKPDEYLAWAAQEMAASPDKVGEVLASAAKLHGYTLVKEGEAKAQDDDDDEDLFLDDATRKIREENARLKAQIAAAPAGGAPSFGPDTPERRAARTVQQELQGFISEKDEAGNAKRPLWDHLQPQITQMAANHKQQTGKPVTVEDLGQFYDAAVEQARRAFGAPPATPDPAPSAAQGGASVSNDLKKRAAAAERAKRASKSIGGAGQGAPRQPAKSSDDDRDNTLDVVKKLAQEMGIES